MDTKNYLLSQIVFSNKSFRLSGPNEGSSAATLLNGLTRRQTNHITSRNVY